VSHSEIEVEVVYALPFAQDSTPLRVPAGTTVAEAIARAGLPARYPELDLGKGRLAVYGRLVSADTVLRDRDRVEILRPLRADPKEVRRRRASLGKR
jgi:putative ubiquitin-RnfH superfamily antitoxin RatB of RatAB toxin-antitoxin module